MIVGYTVCQRPDSAGVYHENVEVGTIGEWDFYRNLLGRWMPTLNGLSRRKRQRRGVLVVDAPTDTQQGGGRHHREEHYEGKEIGRAPCREQCRSR